MLNFCLFLFCSFDCSDSTMVLNVAALYKYISSLLTEEIQECKLSWSVCVCHLKESGPEFDLMMFEVSESLIFLPSHFVYEIQYFWMVTVLVTVKRRWLVFFIWLMIVRTFVGDSGSPALVSFWSCWRAVGTQMVVSLYWFSRSGVGLNALHF